MVLTKADFTTTAVALAKGEEWFEERRREFERNDAKWVIKVLHLAPDNYPEVYVSYQHGRTIYKAWVYPTEDYRIDVL
jgi:hypothetical protein